MHQRTWLAVIMGSLLGGVLSLIPSPAGVGLAWTFHWYYGVLFFVGGLLGWRSNRP